jgi:uncharacterized membrane protein
MIEAHALDSWTLPADRDLPLFGYAMILGGFGAPLFLFLAGVAAALSAGSKLRRTGDRQAATTAVARRGLQIFGLAFLFRLQAYLLSGGGALRSLLKVDILNVMGPSMIAAGALWGLGKDDRRRLALFAVATAAVAMVTPIVRETPWLSPLPDPIEGYLRPRAGLTNFTLLPWAGFVLGGALVGILIGGAGNPSDERRMLAVFAAAGAVLAAGAYGASYLPTIYTRSNFWTSSPTFFFLRLGVLLLALAASYVWGARPTRHRWSPLQQLGLTSLFVYWVHVEMVYGVASAGIHRRLSLGHSIGAYLLFTGFLLGLSVLWSRARGAKGMRKAA